MTKQLVASILWSLAKCFIFSSMPQKRLQNSSDTNPAVAPPDLKKKRRHQSLSTPPRPARGKSTPSLARSRGRTSLFERDLFPSSSTASDSLHGSTASRKTRVTPQLQLAYSRDTRHHGTRPKLHKGKLNTRPRTTLYKESLPPNPSPRRPAQPSVRKRKRGGEWKRESTLKQKGRGEREERNGPRIDPFISWFRLV